MTTALRNAESGWINKWPWQWGIAALLATGLRVGLLWQYGILQWNDSWDYVAYAERLLQTPDLQTLLFDAIDLYSFRTIGYPAFLSVAMRIGGEDWMGVAVAGQIALSLGMLWWLYRFGLALGMGRGYAAIAAGIYACGHLAIYDGSMLTDAVFTHVFIISVCAMLVPLLERGQVSPGRTVLCGCGLAFAVLVRDATLYLVPVVALSLAGVMRERSLSWLQILRTVTLLLFPVVVIWQGYLGWNTARTGRAFVTTVGQSVYLLHPLEIEMRGQAVLQDHRLREAYEATSSTYTYGHAVEINRYLYERHGLNSWQRAELSQQAYWAAWRSAPGAMLMEAVRELRLKFIIQIADVSMAPRDYPIMGGIEERAPFYSRGLIFKTGQTLLRLFSAIIVISCLLGVPAFLVVSALRDADTSLAALVFCWLIFAGMTAMYAMVHVEFRYTLPAQAFVIVAGMAVLRHCVLIWRRRSASTMRA